MTRKNRKFSVIILVSEGGGPAHRIAKDIEQGYGGVVCSQVIGSAHGIPKGWDPHIRRKISRVALIFLGMTLPRVQLISPTWRKQPVVGRFVHNSSLTRWTSPLDPQRPFAYIGSNARPYP